VSGKRCQVSGAAAESSRHLLWRLGVLFVFAEAPASMYVAWPWMKQVCS